MKIEKKAIDLEINQYIIDDTYVLTPCENAFNNKISYWLSKKDNWVSIYAFTPMNNEDFAYHLREDVLKSYIILLEKVLER